MDIVEFVEKLLRLLESEEQPKVEESKQLWEVIRNNPSLMTTYREYHDRDSSKEALLYSRIIEMGIADETDIWSFRTGRPKEQAPKSLQK